MAFTFGTNTLLEYYTTQGVTDVVNSGVSVIRLTAKNTAVESAQTVNTTSATAVTAGSNVITPAAMTNITVGTLLFIFDQTTSANCEEVSVTAVTSTTFTATFVHAHAASNYLIMSSTLSWATLDTAVAGYAGAGLKIILPLGFFNNWWLNGDGVVETKGMCYWGYQMIKRYGSNAAVIAFEMGNEDFSNIGADTSHTPSYYYTDVSKTYPYLKPKLTSLQKLGSFGYTNYGAPGTNGDPSYWWPAFFALGGGAYIDYANFHLYNGGTPPTEWGGSGNYTPPLLTVIGDINAAMATYSLSLPIHVTEFGWQLIPYENAGTTPCPNNVGPYQAAYWIIEAFKLMQTVANVTEGDFYGIGFEPSGHNTCHDLTQSPDAVRIITEYITGQKVPFWQPLFIKRGFGAYQDMTKG